MDNNKIQNISYDIRREMHEIVYDLVRVGYPSVEHVFDFDDLTVVVTMRETGYTKVSIYNEDGECDMPELKKAITDNLIPWSDVEQEYGKALRRDNEHVDDWEHYCKNPQSYF